MWPLRVGAGHRQPSAGLPAFLRQPDLRVIDSTRRGPAVFPCRTYTEPLRLFAQITSPSTPMRFTRAHPRVSPESWHHRQAEAKQPADTCSHPPVDVNGGINAAKTRQIEGRFSGWDQALRHARITLPLLTTPSRTDNALNHTDEAFLRATYKRRMISSTQLCSSHCGPSSGPFLISLTASRLDPDFLIGSFRANAKPPILRDMHLVD